MIVASARPECSRRPWRPAGASVAALTCAAIVGYDDPNRRGRSETKYGPDIYTEADGDPDTLANLGPLAPLAGTWEGTKGADEHPSADGTERDVFVEHYELQPIDRQTNGPQLFYGLRYHTHIVRPGEAETFHDQVGYWLWEPAARAVTLTLGILTTVFTAFTVTRMLASWWVQQQDRRSVLAPL